MKSFILLFTCLLISTIGATQQIDSIGSDDASILLKKMDSTHRADSLHRLDLLREIENLKGHGVDKKRDELLQQLNATKEQDSLRSVRQKQQLEKLKTSAKGFPVVPFGDTLFIVYTRIGSFTASDRAQSVTEKIKQLYRDNSFVPDSLIVTFSEATPQLSYKDIIVMSINDMEALWFGVSQEKLAKDYLQKIQVGNWF